MIPPAVTSREKWQRFRALFIPLLVSQLVYALLQDRVHHVAKRGSLLFVLLMLLSIVCSTATMMLCLWWGSRPKS